MMYFQVRYNSRVIICDHGAFITLSTAPFSVAFPKSQIFSATDRGQKLLQC